MIKQRWRNSIINCRTLPGADIDSDHNLLMADMKLKLKCPKKGINTPKYDIESLKNPDTRGKYSVEISNRFQLLADTERTPNELWNVVKERK